MATGAIGTINNATPASSTFPIAARHFNNLTPGSKYILLGKDRAPLSALVMMMGLGGVGMSSEGVNDRKFDTLTDHPAITNFYIDGDSGAGGADNDAAIIVTTTTFGIKDPTDTITDPRKLLQVGDQLIIPSKQTNQTTADGTVAAMGEVIEVASLPDAYYFTATRNIGAGATTTANVAADSGNYLYAKLLLPADEEATRSREALSHSMQTQTNYIQNFHKSFEITKDLFATMLAGGDQWTREQKQAFDKFMTSLDSTLLFGKKNLSIVDTAKYQTQGWASFLAGDGAAYAVYDSTKDLLTGDHSGRIWNVGDPAALTPQNYMRVMSYVMSEGGDNKILVCGSGFKLQLILAFEGYWVYDIFSVDSKGFNFNLDLDGIRTPDGRIRTLTLNGMDGAYANDAFVFDLDYMGIKKFDGGNYDIGEPHIWAGLDNKGLQDNDSTVKKAAWAAQLGAHMTYKDAHAAFIGMQNDDGTLGGRAGQVGTQTPSDT